MAPSNLVGTLHFGGCWGGRADEQNDRNFLSAARLFSERQAGWLARLGLCQHPDQALLEGVDVGAQFARCARMNQPALAITLISLERLRISCASWLPRNVVTFSLAASLFKSL